MASFELWFDAEPRIGSMNEALARDVMKVLARLAQDDA